MTLLGMWNLVLEQNSVLTKSWRDKPANQINRTNKSHKELPVLGYGQKKWVEKTE